VAWIAHNLHGLKVWELQEEVEVATAAEEPALLVYAKEDTQPGLRDVVDDRGDRASPVTEANLDANGLSGRRDDANGVSLIEEHPEDAGDP
jgi:hypothetical protein